MLLRTTIARHFALYSLDSREGRSRLPLRLRGQDLTPWLCRQTATFPGGTWPPLDGTDVPWGRVDWTDHGYLPGPPHPDPHIHEFYYDPVQKQWQIGPAKPFFGH